MGKIILLLLLSQVIYSEEVINHEKEQVIEKEIITGKSAFFTNSNLIRVKKKNENGRPKQTTEEIKTETKPSDQSEENSGNKKKEIDKERESE